MRPNATVLRHFVHDTNSGLRQIASDFLTAGNRVGEASTRSAHRKESNEVAVTDLVYEVALADADPDRRDIPAHSLAQNITRSHFRAAIS